MIELGINVLYMFFLIENSCLNCFEEYRIQDYEKTKILILDATFQGVYL